MSPSPGYIYTPVVINCATFKNTNRRRELILFRRDKLYKPRLALRAGREISKSRNRKLQKENSNKNSQNTFKYHKIYIVLGNQERK